jgi:hypothetical protein
MWVPRMESWSFRKVDNALNCWAIATVLNNGAFVSYSAVTVYYSLNQFIYYFDTKAVFIGCWISLLLLCWEFCIHNDGVPSLPSTACPAGFLCVIPRKHIHFYNKTKGTPTVYLSVAITQLMNHFFWGMLQSSAFLWFALSQGIFWQQSGSGHVTLTWCSLIDIPTSGDNTSWWAQGTGPFQLISFNV